MAQHSSSPSVEQRAKAAARARLEETSPPRTVLEERGRQLAADKLGVTLSESRAPRVRRSAGGKTLRVRSKARREEVVGALENLSNPRTKSRKVIFETPEGHDNIHITHMDDDELPLVASHGVSAEEPESMADELRALHPADDANRMTAKKCAEEMLKLAPTADFDALHRLMSKRSPAERRAALSIARRAATVEV